MEDRKQSMLQVFFEEDESMKRKLLAIILAALALCMLGGFTLGEGGRAAFLRECSYRLTPMARLTGGIIPPWAP